MVAFVILVVHVHSQRSAAGVYTWPGQREWRCCRCALATHATVPCAGLSLKTLQAYACVFAFRLCSILFYEGYLPFDK